jgi:hypothetical protein
MTDTPHTEAGRRLLRHVRELDSDSLTASAYLDIDAAILAIEAEARFDEYKEATDAAMNFGQGYHEARTEMRTALALHYVTAIDCDHDVATDTVRCNCSVWTGTPQANVGLAVSEWIDHVLAVAALAKASE